MNDVVLVVGKSVMSVPRGVAYRLRIVAQAASASSVD
jgi:hypothetical protein